MSSMFRKETFRLLAFIVFYILYLFIGAAIFSALEYSNEKEIIDNLKKKRLEFFMNHKKCLNDSDLEEFIAHIILAKNRGISLITNLTVEPNWSFGQAVFFSGTVLTTIGYGHVSPLSAGGKVFCIFYALFGIPMTLIMISACVERLMIVTNYLYEAMKRMKCFLNNFDLVNLKLLTYTHLGVVFAFIFVFFFIIPAAIFNNIEKEWDYLDALYYCFISLSTIGLGDYIPGDNYEQPFRVFYKIATTFYLIVGVMFVMLLLSVTTQIPQLNLIKLFTFDDKPSDPEKELLAERTISTPTYSRQIDDEEASSVKN